MGKKGLSQTHIIYTTDAEMEYAKRKALRNTFQPCQYCDQSKDGWCGLYSSWCSSAKHKCSIINK